MSPPLFTIIIPTFRRPDVLSKTLSCLERQECSVPFELILVNDGTADALPDLNFGTGKRLHWKLIQNPRNLGRAATRNRGIKEAQGKYVLMLDDDIWAVPGLVQAHYEKQQEIGGGVVVGAVPPAKEIEDTVWHRYIAARFERVHERLRSQELDFGLFLTGNVSVPVDLLRSIGGFDERFREYSFEDSELGYRLKKSGVRFAHAQEAIGYHFFEEDLKKICKKAYESGRSQAVFIKLHPELFRIMQAHSVTILPWKKNDILKNIVKLALFNALAGMLLTGAASLARRAGMDGLVFRLLPIQELHHMARGYYSK